MPKARRAAGSIARHYLIATQRRQWILYGLAGKNFFESNKKRRESEPVRWKREKTYRILFKCVDVAFISSLFVFMTQNKNKLFA